MQNINLAEQIEQVGRMLIFLYLKSVCTGRAIQNRLHLIVHMTKQTRLRNQALRPAHHTMNRMSSLSLLLLLLLLSLLPHTARDQ